MIAFASLLLGVIGIAGQGAIYNAADASDREQRKQSKLALEHALANAEYDLTYRLRKTFGCSYCEYLYYLFTYEDKVFAQVYERREDASGAVTETFRNTLKNGAIFRSIEMRERSGYKSIPIHAD